MDLFFQTLQLRESPHFPSGNRLEPVNKTVCPCDKSERQRRLHDSNTGESHNNNNNNNSFLFVSTWIMVSAGFTYSAGCASHTGIRNKWASTPLASKEPASLAA